MSRIKQAFVSRFPGGSIVEADLSQIEIVVLAWLSQDPQMLEDVRNGIDFHCKRLAYVLNEDYETVLHKAKVIKESYYVQKRTNIKEFSFQRSYGAGAQAISENIGISVDEVKEFIRAEEQMYPGVVITQDLWIQEVQSNRRPSKKRTTSGKPAGIGWMTGVLGSRYVFEEEDTPEFLVKKGFSDTGFKPTKIKNYQVQGVAGEILKLILGRLYREFKKRPHFDASTLLINTVHDSVMVDTVPENLQEVQTLLQEVMESVPVLVQERYGLDFNVPVRCEVKSGENWSME